MCKILTLHCIIEGKQDQFLSSLEICTLCAVALQMVSRLVLWRTVARCTCRRYMRLTLTRIAERKGGWLLQCSICKWLFLVRNTNKLVLANFLMRQSRTDGQKSGNPGTALTTTLLWQDSCDLTQSQIATVIDHSFQLGTIKFSLQSFWHSRLCIACQQFILCCKWEKESYRCCLSWIPLHYRLSNLH